VSVTTKLPESVLDPGLPAVSVMTPLPPAAMGPDGVWLAVKLTASAAEI